MRRASRVDSNHGAVVAALLSVTDLTVFSLAGVGHGCPDLLVGARGQTFLVEVKDGEKIPSKRLLNPEQQKWIRKWKGSPVVVILDSAKARSWARRIST